MNTSTSRERLWRKRLNELSAVWPDFVNGRTEGLHKTRVASRRIREALPIVGAAAPSAKVRKLSKKMRALTRALGPIRELDVELLLLEDKSRTDGVPGRAIEIIRRDAASRRQALKDELADNTPLDLKKLMRKLERVAAQKGDGHKASGKRHQASGGRHQAAGIRPKASGRGPKAKGARPTAADLELDMQWRAVLAARLIRRAKGVALAMENAGPLYVPERLHEVRISTKKLRYALEIAGDAGIPGALPLIRILKRHQERLGHLHDLQMLLKHVRQTEASASTGARVNDLTAYAHSLDRECRRLHADYVERRADLASVVENVRQNVVPALTTPPRRQAHVAGARRTPSGSRRAK